jgi:DNA-binding beta-propeller fold protein YncE
VDAQFGYWTFIGHWALVIRHWRFIGHWSLVIGHSLALVLLSGCRGGHGDDSSSPEVLRIIGRTGSGPGEFIYPRPIDIAADGTLWLADKTGRVQHLSADGQPLSTFTMPQFEAGKPTGLSVGPDGNIYVADTHYHRVMVFSPSGELLRQFGRFGQAGGEFIYPTYVAFVQEAGAGLRHGEAGPSSATEAGLRPGGAGGRWRTLVSEYGGNDRISVFADSGEFLYSLGGQGSGADQELSRPSAMAVDARRRRLYVADACNHRIVVYDLSVEPYRRATGQAGSPATFGTAGREPGQLRYPYGLALADDGTLAVSEFGNNRVQLFDPDGRSRGVLGSAGREAGQLAFPWGVAIRGPLIYVVDAGNNRVQVWRRK